MPANVLSAIETLRKFLERVEDEIMETDLWLRHDIPDAKAALDILTAASLPTPSLKPAIPLVISPRRERLQFQDTSTSISHSCKCPQCDQEAGEESEIDHTPGCPQED